jgi:hypothetical protein
MYEKAFYVTFEGGHPTGPSADDVGAALNDILAGTSDRVAVSEVETVRGEWMPETGACLVIRSTVDRNKSLRGTRVDFENRPGVPY